MTPPPLGANEPGAPAELADRLAEITRAVPGVADLHGGVFGEVATYLPGRQVAGVRIEDDHVEIHVSVLWNEPVRATAEQVSARVEEVVGRPVYVTVDDVVHPDFPDARDTPDSGSLPSTVSPTTRPDRPGPHGAADTVVGVPDADDTHSDIPRIPRPSKELPS